MVCVPPTSYRSADQRRITLIIIQHAHPTSNVKVNVCLITFPKSQDHQRTKKGNMTEPGSKGINCVEFDSSCYACCSLASRFAHRESNPRSRRICFTSSFFILFIRPFESDISWKTGWSQYCVVFLSVLSFSSSKRNPSAIFCSFVFKYTAGLKSHKTGNANETLPAFWQVISWFALRLYLRYGTYLFNPTFGCICRINIRCFL